MLCHARWIVVSHLMPLFRYHPLAMWLLKNVVGPYLDAHCGQPPTLRDVAERHPLFDEKPTAGWSPVGRPGMAEHLAYHDMTDERRGLSSANINLRRLPKFHQGHDPIRAANLSGEARSTLSMMWFGNAPGGWHTDMQDNVLVQLTGEVDVLAVAAASAHVCGLPMGRMYPLIEYMKSCKEQFGHDARAYHIRLGPGDAVAIPSNTQHRVLCNNTRRVAVNYFFEPEFLQMRWPPATPHTFNYYKALSEDNLAMRLLWITTVQRLWDERGVAMFMHTERMETL